jgi:hypothetical protein
MQLDQLLIEVDLTIAAMTSQSAAWSSIPDTASEDRSKPPRSSILNQSANSTGLGIKSLYASKEKTQ